MKYIAKKQFYIGSKSKSKGPLKIGDTIELTEAQAANYVDNKYLELAKKEK